MRKKELPLVSVIIPAYNAEDFITEALDSIINQTYTHLEIIVVDDGSTDGTKDIILGYGDKVHYIYQKNSGSCSSPRNNGLRFSTADYIVFFDADDVMLPNQIQTLLSVLLDNKDLGMVVSDYQDFGEGASNHSHYESCKLLLAKFKNNNIKKNQYIIMSPNESTLHLLNESFVSACSQIYKREAVESVGGYDEDLKAGEDFYLNYSISNKYNIGVINKIGFKRRLHENNMTKSPTRMLENAIKFKHKLLTQEKRKDNILLINTSILRNYLSLSYNFSGIGDVKKALKYNVLSLNYWKHFKLTTIKLFFKNNIKILMIAAGLKTPSK
ncbi:glycosyltransferase family 2 protein [Alkalimarinus coralli]|uniref:glycosyltransferase family 2 protein n=1 Tax=Alkalimarinus coralli TaxID=2935863 RepID=UPI00202AE5D4|nr:glycosyltransferase family 2 protein [Alkalimarinus coralli]